MTVRSEIALDDVPAIPAKAPGVPRVALDDLEINLEARLAAPLPAGADREPPLQRREGRDDREPTVDKALRDPELFEDFVAPYGELTDDRGVGAEQLRLVVSTFQHYLHLPDPTPLYVVLAAVIANRMPEGDPVWLVIVAGSSRGKTELLICLDGLPGVRIVGKLTAAALISGSSRKERAASAKGGVLMELGSEGILVVKDLGVVLAMQRDSRAELLQMLRDLYDGRVTRDVGVEGGVKHEWIGRAGFVAAATSALDRAHAVLAALGERWLTVRLAEGGEDEMVRRALHTTNTQTMRRELREVVRSFFETREQAEMRQLSEDEEELLVALASLVCLARSPVERDSYTREIVLVHEPEGPARIARQLHKLLCALEAMGLDPTEVRRIVSRVGLDSIPSPRREALLFLLEHGDSSTAQVATSLDLPTRTTERALEELTAHKLLSRRKSGEPENSRNLWTPTEAALARWLSCSPEMSAGVEPELSRNVRHSSLTSPNTPYDDKTGESGERCFTAISETEEEVSPTPSARGASA